MKETADKRPQMVLLFVGTLAIVALIWSFGIQTELDDLKSRTGRRKQISSALEKARYRIKNAETIRQSLVDTQNKLAEVEAGVAMGDPFLWVIRNLPRFQETSAITISTYGLPEVYELTGVTKIPYKIARFDLSGHGFYHDINTFIFQLEEKLPHLRIDRLELDPASALTTSPDEHEKLSFKMELSVLFKPSTPIRPSGPPGRR